MTAQDPALWERVVLALIGKPYAWGASGPEAFDCWGLVSEGLRMIGRPVIVGYTLDDGDWRGAVRVMEERTKSNQWVLADPSEPGDVVALSTHRRIHHVGLQTPYGVLHSLENIGCILSSASRLRAMGYRRIEAYRWAG